MVESKHHHHPAGRSVGESDRLALPNKSELRRSR
jgi:hypothetical protein